MINLKKIEENSRKIFENSFELSLLQEELENMLNALYRNGRELEKGKISKNAFKSNETKLKKNSVVIIKNIKDLIKTNMNLLASMKKEVEGQDLKKKKSKPKKSKEIKVEE